jgi:precorrin-3B C17-methyltransferase
MYEKTIYLGLGPGNRDQMTRRAEDALQESDVICGYGVYIDLIKDDTHRSVFFPRR